MSTDIKFIIEKLKEGLNQEKDIIEVVKEKKSATYEVEIGKYKGNIKIHKANNCWLCEEIKKGCYRMENSNKTLKLEIYKEQNSGDYIIQANGEDVLQQEINYCPECRKKIGGLNNE